MYMKLAEIIIQSGWVLLVDLTPSSWFSSKLRGLESLEKDDMKYPRDNKTRRLELIREL